MSWGPNTLHNLESQRSYATLTASTPPRTVSSSRSPCAQHTCPHTDRHHQSWRNTHRKPSKWWDFSWRLRWGPPPVDIWWRCISIACPLAQCHGKMWMAGRGRSLRPPTPCLAKTDPKNIARAADESARETLLSGSLPRPDHALQHELVPVASRESHWWLPILFAVVFLLGLLFDTRASHASQSAQAAPESSGQLPKMWKEGSEERGDLGNFLLMFFESALTGVVMYQY